MQSPSLPQLQNEGSGAEQFHSQLAPVNWGTALSSMLVPRVHTRSHLSPQPAMLPSGRYWIIQAAGNVSRRKSSNSLTHSLQEFGPSAPKASSLSDRIWANLLAPTALGLSSYTVVWRFCFLSPQRQSYIPGNKHPVALTWARPIFYQNPHGQVEASLYVMWLCPGSSNSDTRARVISKILFSCACINNSLLCM